jgi:hypothetical protein
MEIVTTICNFVDINGVNIIKTWFDQLGPKVKAKLTTRLNALEQMNRGSWSWPLTEVLKGDKDGLIAIRVLYQGIQYRLLGYDGPFQNEFTILSCCTEQNNKYIPLDIGKISFKRKNAVEADPFSRRVRHDFG